MENKNPEKFRYFRTGDIVLDYRGSHWRNRKFRIASFFGERYCPMCSAYYAGREEEWDTHANLCVNDIVLVGARHRPMLKVSQPLLIKLIQKGNVEAKREFIIRSNVKKNQDRLK